MARYAVIDDATDKVVNIIEWDGVTPFDPGPGLKVRKARDRDRMPDDRPRRDRLDPAEKLERALRRKGLLTDDDLTDVVIDD